MALTIYSGRSSCKQTCKLQANNHQQDTHSSNNKRSNNKRSKEDSNNPERQTNTPSPQDRKRR